MRLGTLLLSKLFPTTSTRIGLLPRMDTKVNLQISIDPESFFAIGAFVFFNPRMKGLMTTQVRFLTKAFVAVGALELPILVVHRISVVPQPRVGLECFETCWALVDFGSCSRSSSSTIGFVDPRHLASRGGFPFSSRK